MNHDVVLPVLHILEMFWNQTQLMRIKNNMRVLPQERVSDEKLEEKRSLANHYVVQLI